jgi:hypothetical protein
MLDKRFKNIPKLAAYSAAGSTGTVTGTAVDVQGKAGVAFFLNVTEATGLTSATMKLQVSANNSDWTDAVAADTVAADAADTTVALDDVGQVALSYSGTARYVRPAVVLVATDVDINVISVVESLLTNDSISIPA